MKVNNNTPQRLGLQRGVVPSGISPGGRRFSCPLPLASIMRTKSEAANGKGYSLNSMEFRRYILSYSDYTDEQTQKAKNYSDHYIKGEFDKLANYCDGFIGYTEEEILRELACRLGNPPEI